LLCCFVVNANHFTPRIKLLLLIKQQPLIQQCLLLLPLGAVDAHRLLQQLL
jgi:hypothetical protein